MLNALSIDLEEYFHASVFDGRIDPHSWERRAGGADVSTRLLLDLFDRHRTTVTFFVLGWVAERFPELIREIHRRGHEIASHGSDHQMLARHSTDSFRNEVRAQKALLESLTNEAVIGYRAPSFSITRQTRWALDVLREEGFRYDSSIFPVHHDRYGIPDSPRFPHDIETPSGVLREFPPSTISVGRLPNLPFGGGGYLRIYPMWLTRWGIRRVNTRERQPVMVYLHPWEIDHSQPRISVPRFSRWRHYTNLDRMEARLDALLREFQFGPVRTVLGFAESRDRDREPVAVGARGDRLKASESASLVRG